MVQRHHPSRTTYHLLVCFDSAGLNSGVLRWGDSPPSPSPGGHWAMLGCLSRGRGDASGRKPGVLLIKRLHCTGQPITKTVLVQNVSSAEVEKNGAFLNITACREEIRGIMCLT